MFPVAWALTNRRVKSAGSSLVLKLRQRFVKVGHDLNFAARAAKYSFCMLGSCRGEDDKRLSILVDHNFFAAGSKLQQFNKARFGLFEVDVSYVKPPCLTWPQYITAVLPL